MRSILTVLGITIGIAAVICVVAIGNAGQARVQQQLNNLGDNFVWVEAGGRAVNGVRTGTHDTKTLVMADAVAIKNQVSLIKSVSPNLVVNGYAAQTRTPGFSSGQTNLGAGFDYQTNWLEVFAQHRKVGPNFNPEVGFLGRTDCICDYLDVNFKPRPKLPGVRDLNFEGFIFHAPDTHHVLQTQEWQNTFRIDFHNGSYSDDDIVDVFTQRLITPFNIYKNVSVPIGEYHWTRHQLTYGTSQEHRFIMNFFERFGTYYNGHLNEANVRATYRTNERLSFSFSEQWNRFRLGTTTDPAGTVLPSSAGDFSVVVGSFQTNYSFSRFLTLSALLQMDTANIQAASANIRLRWNYRPDSDLYVIYTAGQRFASLVAANPPQFYENRFAIKFTYSWRP